MGFVVRTAVYAKKQKRNIYYNGYNQMKDEHFDCIGCFVLFLTILGIIIFIISKPLGAILFAIIGTIIIAGIILDKRAHIKQIKEQEVWIELQEAEREEEEKYHRANCKYLRKSKIPITLSEAIKRGYTPCSVCKPDPPVELNNKSNLVIPLKEKILIKKPTVIIPNLKVESISNSWGQISLDTTTINTEILVNDPNFYLIPIKVDCDIYLNDIKMVSGIGKDLQITRSASGSLIRFTSTIDNENVIKWWVSHIKNKEKTKVRIEGKLIISLDKVDIVYPFSQNSEFKTHILRDLNKKNLATIRPYNFKIRSLESRWEKVTLSTTEIRHKFTIENIGILPGQPITDIDYTLVFNGIQMTKGRIGLPLLILPGQRRSARFTLKIPNRNIIKWWVSHIKIGEKTKYYFQYRFWIKPFIKSR